MWLNQRLHRWFNQFWRLFSPQFLLQVDKLSRQFNYQCTIGSIGLTVFSSLDRCCNSALHRPVDFPSRQFNRSPDFYWHLSNSSRLSFGYLKYILSLIFHYNLDTSKIRKRNQIAKRKSYWYGSFHTDNWRWKQNVGGEIAILLCVDFPIFSLVFHVCDY